MNARVIEQIADAVLYEGYMLYPYRQSAIKNRQRFNFGVLYPREFCYLQAGSESWEMRTECLIEGESSATIEAKVRFLQMVTKGDWQEGQERDISVAPRGLGSIAASPCCQKFDWPGEVEMAASPLEGRLGPVFKVSLTVRNLAKLETPNQINRDEALLRAMVSVHSILHAEHGKFVSLFDPPEEFKSAAAECRNSGTWPVLAGEQGRRDFILSAPIILYDYPQVAPESPGDLFDGTEIDEILALRILTLTDEEKAEVRNGDKRARRILERTEMLPAEHFQKLHGALRGLRTPPESI